MTDRLDRLVRGAIHDLAANADVISDRDRRRLAVHATDRALTLRVRRRATVAAMVTLVTALAVGIPYGLRFLSSRLDFGPAVVQLPAGVSEIPGVPTHVIDDTSSPIELVDGWYVAGNEMVLNRETGRYDDLGLGRSMLSPNGRWVATLSSRAVRIDDLQTGEGYPLRGTEWDTMEWSPDGDRLLLQSLGQAGETFLHNVTTRLAETVVVETCEGGCSLDWMPSGTELATPILATDSDGNPIAGIQTFTLDCTAADAGDVQTCSRAAILPIRGYPAGLGAWSPDGRNVIVRVYSDVDTIVQTQIVDVATGAVVRSLDAGDLVQAQWIDDNRFLLWEPIITGEERSSYFRAIASLWTVDGELLERWIPPIEIVAIGSVMKYGPLAVRLD